MVKIVKGHVLNVITVERLTYLAKSEHKPI